MSISRWRAHAREVMQGIARENPELKLQELLELIDKAYPFGERRYWPYKQWLLERREFIDMRAAPRAGLERTCPACGAKPGKPCQPMAFGELWQKVLPPRDEIHEARTKLDHGPLFGAT